MPVDPTTLQADCRACGLHLWGERQGQYTLKTRVLKHTENGLVALCPRCRTEVPVPFLALRKPRRRLVVRLDRRAPP